MDWPELKNEWRLFLLSTWKKEARGDGRRFMRYATAEKHYTDLEQGALTSKLPFPMPSSVLADMDRLTNGQLDADQRELQIALELSMLGLTSEDDTNSNVFDDIRNKKSMNMTDCVPVPSSEHVAEIVGRQGRFSQASTF